MEQENQIRYGRLATPGLAYEAKGFACVDGKTDVIDSMHMANDFSSEYSAGDGKALGQSTYF
jgi:hypothetical protein